VAPLNVDATFDLDERATAEVSEIGAPFARLVESEFAFERRSAERLPVEQEPAFEPGRRNGVAISRFAIFPLTALAFVPHGAAEFLHSFASATPPEYQTCVCLT